MFTNVFIQKVGQSKVIEIEIGKSKIIEIGQSKVIKNKIGSKAKKKLKT